MQVIIRTAPNRAESERYFQAKLVDLSSRNPIGGLAPDIVVRVTEIPFWNISLTELILLPSVAFVNGLYF